MMKTFRWTFPEPKHPSVEQQNHEASSSSKRSKIWGGAICATVVSHLILGVLALIFVATYDPVMEDGSIDNAPSRGLASALLLVPFTLIIGVVYFAVSLGLANEFRSKPWKACLVMGFLTCLAFTALTILVMVSDGAFSLLNAFIALGSSMLIFGLPLTGGFIAGLNITLQNKPLRPTDK